MPVLHFEPIDHFDGVFRDYIRAEGSAIVRTRWQPGRDEAMRAIKQIRDEGWGNNQPETALGRATLVIPHADYWNLVAINPELNSTDRDTLDRAWRKFSASPESMPYRVNRGILA